MKSSWTARASAFILLLASVILLGGAVYEFYNMAWGTGTWLGQFSLKWGIGFAFFVVLCIMCLVGFAQAARAGEGSRDFPKVLGKWQGKLGALPWILASVLAIAPAWFLQYTAWGVAIRGPYIRILIWVIISALIAYVMALRQLRLSMGFTLGVLLTGLAFAVAAAFAGVTKYPFSLGWSEGNRLWDYSLLFGKRLYSYAPMQTPVAYLDIGRQLAGGLPFLLPRVSILAERLWLASLGVIPYLALGALVFWPGRPAERGAAVLAAVWAFIFLDQGPIHSPLLLCAILVLIAWRLPTWAAMVLVAISGYFAEISRFTWMFAPAIWAAMLAILDSTPRDSSIPTVTWRRATLLASAGVAGALAGIVGGVAGRSQGISATTGASTSQALLWYRLFPNATYASGILLGLGIAAGPALIWLVNLLGKVWRLSRLRQLGLVLPAAAFLVVGLIVSTKIGGGGDLHNLDMFLITVVFTGGLAWKAVGPEHLLKISQTSLLRRGMLILLVALPAYPALMALRPLSFGHDSVWLSVLADAARPRDLGSLPTEDVVRSSLDEIANAVRDAEPAGDVLFMDQRQLLTFGAIQHVDLVPAYEKKLMMDQALSGNRAYFRQFYADLASHRFPLIISSPLRTPIKDSEYGFGEENNAWVQWVARPILCFYDEKDTLTEVKVELLTPRVEPSECSTILP